MGDFDGWKARYLGYVDRVLAHVPYKRAVIWKEFFLNPLPTLKKDDVGIGQRMKDLFVTAAVGSVFQMVMYLPMLAIMAILSLGTALIMALFYLGIIAVNLIAAPVMGFLYSLLELLVAKALGGRGDMRANFNASALPGLGVWAIMLPALIAFVPILWLSMIPFVSLCTMVITLPASLLMFGIAIYALYLKYLAMKEVHGLTSERAALVVILPFVILAVLMVLAIIAVYIAVFAAMMGSMGAAGGLGAGGAAGLN